MPVMQLGLIPGWQFNANAYPNGYGLSGLGDSLPPLSPEQAQAFSADVSAPTMPTAPEPESDAMRIAHTVYHVMAFAGGLLGAYHGYKRHHGSIGWAIGWSLMGSMFWPISVPVAFAQGIGKPMTK